MPDIVISEFMDQAAVNDLARDYDVLYDPDLVQSPQRLQHAAAQCRVLIVRNRTEVRAPLLDVCASLKAVGRLGVGLDNIDLEACHLRGIKVLPAIGANDIAVAEYVIAGLLMLLRGAYHAHSPMISGEWPRSRLIGREIAGRTLGLIGFGRTARAVAERARALGMSISACDPHIPPSDPSWALLRVERRELESLLAESDALSIHVPLTDETRHLIDRSALRRMKPSSVLINAARGGIVDERALADALRHQALAGAMLDVYEFEPLAATNAFLNVPNLILTPHIAGVTLESNARVSAVTGANVRQVLRGMA
ncbi:MAG: hydroxyacid dehydrogenase [Acidiferrobacteraceae bacterium]